MLNTTGQSKHSLRNVAVTQVDETSPEEYDFRRLEAKWRPIWDELDLFNVDKADPELPRKYVLDMFPYPSGDLHMGHAEQYALGDAVARYWRHLGYNVLHPIGWDSFGLPAENAAIKHGGDPKEWTYNNIAQQRESMRRYGASFDWSRVLHTSDPSTTAGTSGCSSRCTRRGSRIAKNRS